MSRPEGTEIHDRIHKKPGSNRYHRPQLAGLLAERTALRPVVRKPNVAPATTERTIVPRKVHGMSRVWLETDRGIAGVGRFDPGHVLLAATLLGLGLLGAYSGDFASVWQRIPIADLPARTSVAYATAAMEIAIGIGLLFRRSVGIASRALVVFFLLWAVLLKLPAVVVVPWMEATWLGLAEITVMLAGAWVVSLRFNARKGLPVPRFLAGPQGVRNARILFALSLIPIGLSHFFYVDQTAALVPSWLPWRVGWAYLTGAGSLAASLAILTGICARPAAALETAMLAIVTVLVWMPGLAPAPNGLQFQVTGFLISAMIAAGAWNVASTYGRVAGHER